MGIGHHIKYEGIVCEYLGGEGDQGTGGPFGTRGRGDGGTFWGEETGRRGDGVTV
ncbi:MAG: hypothetical protein Fur0025_19560 [Oscillatoriaceae cyanobacterium]